MTPEQISIIVKKYIKILGYNIDKSPKFSHFKSNDPDYDKETILRLASEVSTENVKEKGEPQLEPYQFMDILKEIKKSNEIAKLLEVNHAYITHINEKGKLVYVFTNYGYKRLKDLDLI